MISGFRNRSRLFICIDQESEMIELIYLLDPFWHGDFEK